MTGHSIKLAMDADGVTGYFECHEGPDGWCHQVCSLDCEVMDVECMENHPSRSVGYCNPIAFVSNGGYWYETFVGAKTGLDCEPRSGPIVFEWQDDWYGWRYADDVDLSRRADAAPSNTDADR